MPEARIPAVIRWPHRVKGPWTIRLHFKKIGGREECVGFEFWGGSPVDESPAYGPLPPKVLRAADIRKPPFAELVAASREAAVQGAQRLLESADPAAERPDTDEATPLDPATEQYLRQRVVAFGDGSAAGRPQMYGPEFYAEVADVYRKAWKKTGKPLVAIMEQWPVSKSAAAKWVAKCRKMDLLPKTQRGIPKIEEES